MSNDLILSIKNRLAEIGGGVDEDTRAVAGGGGGNSKRISIKGGVFRKIVGGKEIAAIEDRSMNVIFVRMSHDPSRTYYAQGYQEGGKISPACWSSNSKTPDPEVKNPQGPSCDRCPQSVKGSGQGGTGTACRMQWRTAVVLPTDPSGDVMQLVIPATSCFGESDSGKYPFRPYIQFLAANSISAGRVITKMSFDTKFPVPRILFSAVAAVEQETIDVIKEQSASTAAENAIKLTVYQMDEGSAPAQPARVMVDAPDEAPAEAVVEEGEDTPEPVKREVKRETAAAGDVPDIISKWSKKG